MDGATRCMGGVAPLATVACLRILRPCLVALGPFRYPIQNDHFRNGGKAVFTAEMDAKRNGFSATKQGLSPSLQKCQVYFLLLIKKEKK